MQIVSLVWGVFAFIGMVIAFLPFLGNLNWFNLPFAGVGLILSLIALTTSKSSSNGTAIVGLVANGVAAAVAVIRLFLGGGLL
jgi:hypothetical protein